MKITLHSNDPDFPRNVILRALVTGVNILGQLATYPRGVFHIFNGRSLMHFSNHYISAYHSPPLSTTTPSKASKELKNYLHCPAKPFVACWDNTPRQLHCMLYHPTPLAPCSIRYTKLVARVDLIPNLQTQVHFHRSHHLQTLQYTSIYFQTFQDTSNSIDSGHHHLENSGHLHLPPGILLRHLHFQTSPPRNFRHLHFH